MLVEIILIGIVIIFTVVLIIKRFIYFQPSVYMLPKPENYTEIQEGKLNAWYVKSKTDSNKVILFCHGNAGNISDRQEKINKLSEICNVLIFDYSGYGKSSGIPNEQTCYDNASVFVNFLYRNDVKKENIIPYGESLGGPVAIYISRKYGLPKTILESTFPSISCLIKQYKILKFFSFLFWEFNTRKYLNGYKGKVLMLHSKEDDIIPYSITEEMKDITTFITISGTHNNPIIPWEIIKDFIN